MGVDFFSTMYLPSLHCHRAAALMRLGRGAEARALLNGCIAEWKAGLDRKDHGYFETTPFFLSFLELPARLRRAHFNYLLGMAHAVLGDHEAARQFFAATLEINRGHLWAAVEMEFPFPTCCA
jgi:tetratricopeptide (TPR) repeat protein